jgi:hypothetical protein
LSAIVIQSLDAVLSIAKKKGKGSSRSRQCGGSILSSNFFYHFATVSGSLRATSKYVTQWTLEPLVRDSNDTAVLVVDPSSE